MSTRMHTYTHIHTCVHIGRSLQYPHTHGTPPAEGGQFAALAPPPLRCRARAPSARGVPEKPEGGS